MAARHLALSGPRVPGEDALWFSELDLCQVSGKASLQVRSVCQTVTWCQESLC
jgi:hypothetical protein